MARRSGKHRGGSASRNTACDKAARVVVSAELGDDDAGLRGAGMDEAVVDAQGNIRKVLINDQVFIIRDNKVYSIDGQLVRWLEDQ